MRVWHLHIVRQCNVRYLCNGMSTTYLCVLRMVLTETSDGGVVSILFTQGWVAWVYLYVCVHTCIHILLCVCTWMTMCDQISHLLVVGGYFIQETCVQWLFDLFQLQ